MEHPEASPLEVFLREDVLKIYWKFTGGHPCQRVISIKLLIEIALRHGCSPANLLYIFRIPLYERLWRAASVHGAQQSLTYVSDVLSFDVIHLMHIIYLEFLIIKVPAISQIQSTLL